MPYLYVLNGRHRHKVYHVGKKPDGEVIGKSDDLGWGVVEDPVHINDYHATILHQFGFDHRRLTYRFQGRDFRLTDVRGQVVRKLLA